MAAVICDFARYPEWAQAMKSVEVLEEYEDGYASQVRFALDAGVLADEYTLQYEYAEDISRIEWHLVAPSKMQKAQNGSYDIADNGDGTLDGDLHARGRPAIGMLGMFRRKAEKMIMDAALKQLKRRVESLGAARWRARPGRKRRCRHPDPGSAREEAERLRRRRRAGRWPRAVRRPAPIRHARATTVRSIGRPARPSAASARSAG